MITEKLQTATFKGVPFYWKSLKTQLGKKSVTHNYPGSSRRFVEDMGQFPKVFTIDAEIGGGDAYLENKQALEAAIATPGPGLLVHPTYGQVQVMAKPATCTETLSEVGIAKYQLTFEKTEKEIKPSDTAPTVRKVEQKKEEALAKVITEATAEYNLPESPSFFEKAARQIDALSAEFQNAAGAIATKRADAFQVFNSIEALKRNAADLVTQPFSFYNDMKAIYDQVMSMDDFVDDQFRRMQGFFGQSYDSGPGQSPTSEQPITPYSYESKNAEENRQGNNEASNMFVLINIYVVIVKIDFTSTDDLDDAVDYVEEKFQMMSDSVLMQKPLRDDVIVLRDTARQLLDEKRLSTKKIVERNLPDNTPLAIALFEQQGDIEDIEFIIGLNPNQDITFASGEARLLE